MDDTILQQAREMTTLEMIQLMERYAPGAMQQHVRTMNTVEAIQHMRRYAPIDEPEK